MGTIVIKFTVIKKKSLLYTVVKKKKRYRPKYRVLKNPVSDDAGNLSRLIWLPPLGEEDCSEDLLEKEGSFSYTSI